MPFSFRSLKRGYTRKCGGRWVPRFVCEACGRRFSQQTFAARYCLKRPELLEPIARGLVAGSGYRPLGRSLGCAHSTVTRMAARLGRHAILLTTRMLEHFGPLDEVIGYGPFETFGVAQDSPIGVGSRGG